MHALCWMFGSGLENIDRINIIKHQNAADTRLASSNTQICIVLSSQIVDFMLKLNY